MLLTGRIVLVVFWAVWAYPFIFRAPHNQKRPSITAIVPTRVGLVLECLGIFIACLSGLPNHELPAVWRVIASVLCGAEAKSPFGVRIMLRGDRPSSRLRNMRD